MTKYKVFPSDIFNHKNLTAKQRKLMVFLHLIHVNGIVPLISIQRRWEEKGDVHGRLSSQLRHHLIALEKQGYIERYKNGSKFTAVKINFDRIDSIKVGYIRSEIPENLGLSLTDIYVFCAAQLISPKAKNHLCYIAKKCGIDKDLVARSAKSLSKANFFEAYTFEKDNFKNISYRISKQYVMKFRQPKKPRNKGVNKVDEISEQRINNKLLLNKTLHKGLKFIKKQEEFDRLRIVMSRPKRASEYSKLGHLNHLKKLVRRKMSYIHEGFETKFDNLVNSRLKTMEGLVFKNDYAFVGYVLACFNTKVRYDIEKPREKRVKTPQNSETIHNSVKIGGILSKIMKKFG